MSMVVESNFLCNCGNRWRCQKCRETRVGKLKRSILPWIKQGVGVDGQALELLMTCEDSNHFENALGLLWPAWSGLGKKRRRAKRCGTNPLSGIRRGVACLHVANKRGALNAHLHCVLACDPNIEFDCIDDFCRNKGLGYRALEPVRSLERCLHYSLNALPPTNPNDVDFVETFLSRKHLVRRIGSKEISWDF